jgi:hypothetical protein
MTPKPLIFHSIIRDGFQEIIPLTGSVSFHKIEWFETKKEILEKIKTDSQFCVENGIEYSEKILSQSERFNWYGDKIGSFMHHDHIEQEMDENGVPTKKISIIWNNQTIEVYE